jgi:hypothetical protein
MKLAHRLLFVSQRPFEMNLSNLGLTDLTRRTLLKSAGPPRRHLSTGVHTPGNGVQYVQRSDSNFRTTRQYSSDNQANGRLHAGS